MPPSAGPSLSLSEWLVLCLVGEEPRHGFGIARLLGAGGSLGQVWRVPKPVVYRALQRLEQLGYVQTTGVEPSTEGPVRSLIDVTPSGREAASAWLARPASHNRDVRSELLAKLALLDRAGADPRPLLDAQREQLLPVVTALRERLASATGFDRTIAAWRWETVSATLRFLDAVSRAPAAMTPAP
ncbi:MAG: PadR family transcriptional regulator [Streptosporangiaceae bacterium]